MEDEGYKLSGQVAIQTDRSKDDVEVTLANEETAMAASTAQSEDVVVDGFDVVWRSLLEEAADTADAEETLARIENANEKPPARKGFVYIHRDRYRTLFTSIIEYGEKHL